jgi:hypothetical protein
VFSSITVLACLPAEFQIVEEVCDLFRVPGVVKLILKIRFVLKRFPALSRDGK